LQDFYGMTATPVVGRGTPVVVRLLAPNNRPVQQTTDLAGFWTRLYPQIRKELSRRYPKHKWP
jgi:ATP-dependent helicase HrpB